MLANALERVGDRWTLLVVRDLIAGPLRFTDLVERLGGITPKTLSQRLKELESEGLVDVDRQPGRREVWYRLTPAGRDLYPALEELLLWGLRHTVRPPEPGEPAHPEHLLWALRVQLQREGVNPGPVRWLVRLVDDGSYVLRNESDGWVVDRGDVDDPDVLITATKDAWARFVAMPPSMRSPEQFDIHIGGGGRAIRTFLKALEAFPFGRESTTKPPTRKALAETARPRRPRDHVEGQAPKRSLE
jgi:DNA-binding HxlR family transcriptional regulator